ncbi:MAG: hypothetical protein RE468_09005 [Acidithiobacillus caldus]|uniref:hypothetical protein n=1 Tax=Acidithiobacillus caldus TaxID=33059 RepID=UPI0028162FCF|nr:hypothetical protein [Acidithiobacillus caldus]WMT46046.1 MAG: hypothetical protein RE468_09005 [Acidithiobacillus caldus]
MSLIQARRAAGVKIHGPCPRYEGGNKPPAVARVVGGKRGRGRAAGRMASRPQGGGVCG